mgnify:CR=1 FL=1
MVMRSKDPAREIQRRHFKREEVDYAMARGVTEAQLQATHANAAADGLADLNFVRVMVCARAGIQPRFK